VEHSATPLGVCRDALRSDVMQPPPFVTIRCPSCGSGDVRALEHGRYACVHCQSSFLYTGARVARVADPASPGSGGALVAIVAFAMVVFGGAVFFLFFAAGGSDVAPTPVPSQVVAAVPTPVAVAAPREIPVAAPPSPTPKGIATPDDPSFELAMNDEPPKLTDFQELRGCSCAKNVARLHVRSTGRTTMLSDAGLTLTRHLEFAVLAADGSLWRMPTVDGSAPSVAYTKGDISMGVGCKDDTLVVAAGMSVSAWSLSRHTLLWSHGLAAPFGKYDDGPGSEMGIDCDSLRASKDSVAVRAGKRTVKLGLADGAVK
jgi:hypothetical protein